MTLRVPSMASSALYNNFPPYLLSDVESFSRDSAQYILPLTDVLPVVSSPFPFRFVVKIAFTASGCWIWQGTTGFHPKHRQHRYGQVRLWFPEREGNARRGMTTAHRFAYECVHGPVAKQLDVDHLCENKLCVNPEHLEAVTHKENCRRRAARRKP